jgi:predicted MFS family arabinose efflux permease
MGLLPDGAAKVRAAVPLAADAEGLTMRETLRTSEFWTMAGALGLVTASVHACFIHLPAILSDRGSTAQTAAMVSSLFGVGLLLGRVGCGYFLDQFLAPRVAAVFFACAGIGAATLATTEAVWSSCAASVLVGLGIGAEVDIIAYLTTRYFGLRSFGEIFGWLWAVFGVSGGIGAYLMGVGFDKTGSYTLPLAGFSVAAFTAMLLVLFLGPYRYRVRTSGSGDAATAIGAPAPTLGAR